jgi:hypothetical protein
VHRVPAEKEGLKGTQLAAVLTDPSVKEHLMRKFSIVQPLSIVIGAYFAAAGFAAHAADDAYKNARKQADETYKMDKKNCKGMDRKDRDTCMHQAKSKHDQEIGEARKLKTHGAARHGDASQTQTSASQLPANGAASASQPRTAGNRPGEFMGNAPGSAAGTTNAAK